MSRRRLQRSVGNVFAASGEWPIALFEQITDLLAEALVVDYQQSPKNRIDSGRVPGNTPVVLLKGDR